MIDRRAFLKAGGLSLFTVGAGPSFLARAARATASRSSSGEPSEGAGSPESSTSPSSSTLRITALLHKASALGMHPTPGPLRHLELGTEAIESQRMHDAIDLLGGSSHGVRVANIALHGFDVEAFQRPVVTGLSDHSADRFPPREERPHHVVAEQSGRSGDQCCHATNSPFPW